MALYPQQAKAVQVVETLIIHRVIEAMLKAGYTLDVYDRDEMKLRNCSDAASVLKCLHATESDHLYGRKNGRRKGWIRLALGNCGFDVIGDYTSNLHAVLLPVLTWIGELEDAPSEVLTLIASP